jgi:hypothetical protein
LKLAKKQQKSPHQTKLKAVVTLHGIFLTSLIKINNGTATQDMLRRYAFEQHLW